MSGEESYDAVVIGAGPGGRGVAKRLAKAGMRVAMAEQELVGGECPFWACIPSKWLLRPVEARGEASHVPGLDEPALRWPEIAEYRDYMNSALDDTKKAKSMADAGVEIVRGHSRIVLATGTTSAKPGIDGLDSVDYWTNREATTLTEVPKSATVLGGGPVGVELGQMLSRYGARVTIVEGEERLLSREHVSVGDQLGELLRAEGIDLKLGVKAKRAARDGDGIALELESGERLSAEKLLIAVGRTPRVDGIGLEQAGIEPGERGNIEVDERCRTGEGVWAVGDVTGVSQFTHVAAYQARIVVADILGKPRTADYSAVPRVVFCDPEVAAVGLTPGQAAQKGLQTATSTVDLSGVDRTETYGRDLSGHMGVVADADRGVLVGAWAVGPLTSEWIHALVVAIRAEVPIAVLRDTIAQFPTFSEAMATAVEELDL
jgi:pyruvate/2-oxoglutarate dehydrogenase complex dihydrolipoamide dehydrogenase (E3) component